MDVLPEANKPLFKKLLNSSFGLPKMLKFFKLAVLKPDIDSWNSQNMGQYHLSSIPIYLKYPPVS